MASFIKFVHGLYMSDFSCTNVHTSTNVQVQMHVYTCYQYGGCPHDDFNLNASVSGVGSFTDIVISDKSL